MTVRTRFAPSPTGLLHVGNARTAVFNWLFTRNAGGAFVLRIEDTDRERSSAEFERRILADLEWLGVVWDEGGEKGGPFGPYHQSERWDSYQIDFQRLRKQKDLYPCFCTPGQREADRAADLKSGRPPQYPGRCRDLDPAETDRRRESGERHAWRLRVPAGRVAFEDLIRGMIEVDSSQIGDPVVFRSDGWPLYNFAVVADDIRMRITHVVRGEDHISNTPRQILLYRALGEPPPRFAHLPLVLGPDHAPLSKRHQDTSLGQYRERGYLPEAILNYLALLGWSSPSGKEILSREDLIREFDLSRVGKSAGVFDVAKLDWVAHQHLRSAGTDRLTDLAVPFLQAEGALHAPVSAAQRDWVKGLLEMMKESLAHLSQLPGSDAVGILLRFDPQRCLTDPELRTDLNDPRCREVIRTFAALLPAVGPIDVETYRRVAQETGKATRTKGRDLYHPIRVALTARPSGPELVRLVPLIEQAASADFPAPVPGCAERAAAVAQLPGLPS